MIDAILFAIRDSLWASGFGYNSSALAEIMDDGKPPPQCGNLFVSIHEAGSTNTSLRNLDEYFNWSLTLTQRVTVPLNRVGNMMLASKLARMPGKGQPSFNARVEQLKCWAHMNWTLMMTANANLTSYVPPNVTDFYGFVEPAHFAGTEKPILVGGEWFTVSPESDDTGLKAEIRLEGERRMQPQSQAIGPFI